MIRKGFIIIIAVSIAYYIVIEKNAHFEAHGENILSFFSVGNDRFYGKNSDTLPTPKPLPIITESR